MLWLFYRYSDGTHDVDLQCYRVLEMQLFGPAVNVKRRLFRKNKTRLRCALICAF